MKISVVPRKWFSDRKGADEEKQVFANANVISIITPAYPKKNFEEEDIPFSEEYRNADNVLVLKFHDTELQWDDDVVLMNKSDADKVYDFVQKTKGNGKPYIVHCTAGKSRSQAVGYILNLWFNGEHGISPNPDEFYEYEDSHAMAFQHMNSLVKRLLNERFFFSGD